MGQILAFVAHTLQVVLLGGSAGSFWVLWSFAKDEDLTFLHKSSNAAVLILSAIGYSIAALTHLVILLRALFPLYQESDWLRYLLPIATMSVILVTPFPLALMILLKGDAGIKAICAADPASSAMISRFCDFISVPLPLMIIFSLLFGLIVAIISFMLTGGAMACLRRHPLAHVGGHEYWGG